MNESEIIKRFEAIETRLGLLEGKNNLAVSDKINGSKIKKGSTSNKIISLISEGFFDKPKSITKIVYELKNKDYHFKSPDLTLPLRGIVRRGLLKKNKGYEEGSKLKKWLYQKCLL